MSAGGFAVYVLYAGASHTRVEITAAVRCDWIAITDAEEKNPEQSVRICRGLDLVSEGSGSWDAKQTNLAKLVWVRES